MKKYFVYHGKSWQVDLYSTTGFSSSQEQFRSWRESWLRSRTRTSLQRRCWYSRSYENMVIVTIDMFRLKMRSVTAVEVAKATRSPNGVNVELCHYLLNLKRGSMSKKTKSLQNLVKSNQLNFIPRSQNTIMLAHHLLFLLSLHADQVHTHLSADVPRVQPTCLE